MTLALDGVSRQPPVQHWLALVDAPGSGSPTAATSTRTSFWTWRATSHRLTADDMKSDAGAAVATLDSHATTPKVVDEESCGRWRSDGQQRSASPARCLPVRTAGEASDDQLVAPSTAHFHGVCRARRRLCPSTHDQRLAPGRGAGRGGHKMGTNAGIRAVSGWYPAAPDGRPEQPREGRSPWSAGLFRLVTRGSASGTPNGIRTRAATLRGWCPRPLDDGGRTAGHASDATGRAKNRIPADHCGRSLWRAWPVCSC